MGFSYIMEGGYPLVGFQLMGFHLDNIDGCSYSTLFHNMVKNDKSIKGVEEWAGYKFDHMSSSRLPLVDLS